MSSSVVTAPRFRVTLNGDLLAGVAAIKVILPFGFNIGHFDFIKFFTNGDQFPASWWAATESKTMLISIAVSLDGVTFQQIISGNVDNHKFDPIENTICVAGRDLAATMCDERVVNTFRNQTASQIVETFAAEHKLEASITATKAIVGRFYDTDHDEIIGGNFSSVANQWDLICRLGSSEGITPYVLGNTLYFNPRPEIPPIVLVNCLRNATGQLVSNVTNLQLERHMTEARDISVTVRSWNSRKKSSLSATVRTRSQPANGPSEEQPTNYLLVAPNLTQSQCLAKAQQLALDYSLNEKNLFATFPALGPLDPQAVVQLSGTGTDYDAIYYPQRVTVCLDFENGLRSDVFAKASSAVSLYDNDTGQQITSGPVA